MPARRSLNSSSSSDAAVHENVDIPIVVKGLRQETPGHVSLVFGRFREVRGSWRSRVELQSTEVEVDGGLEVLAVAVAAG